MQYLLFIRLTGMSGDSDTSDKSGRLREVNILVKAMTSQDD